MGGPGVDFPSSDCSVSERGTRWPTPPQACWKTVVEHARLRHWDSCIHDSQFQSSRVALTHRCSGRPHSGNYHGPQV
jgi:hypothetical protein